MKAPIQLNLFLNEAKPIKNTFTCIKDWITKDGRHAFIFGKEYKTAKTSQLALIGENYIVIFLSHNRLIEHFTN